MKKPLTISLLIFLALVITKQSDGQSLISLQKSKIEKQVDSIFHTMIKAAEYLDYDKLTTGVDDRNNAGFISNGSYYTKYDSLVNILKANKPDGAHQRITIQKEKITVLSENIVLITASGEAKIELNATQSFTTRFLWTFVYEKINNDWKVIQSHQSKAN